jgi:Zn-dependent protease with chaperone function
MQANATYTPVPLHSSHFRGKQMIDRDERPGMGIIRMWLIPFTAVMATSIITGLLLPLFVIHSWFVLLSGFVSLYVFYVVASKAYLYRWTKSNRLTYSGHTDDGIPTYIVKDKLANAVAVGLLKRGSFIVASDALIDTLDESEVESIIEHESNHIKYLHTLILLTCVGLVWTAYSSAIYTLGSGIADILVGSILPLLVGIVFIRSIQRGIEDIADRVKAAETQHSALMKIEAHNKSVMKQESRSKSVSDHNPRHQRGHSEIFATHPATEMRPRKFDSTNQSIALVLFVAVMVAISTFTRSLILVSSDPAAVLPLVFVTLFTITAGTIVGLLSYSVAKSLIVFLAEKMGIRDFNVINVLNGLFVFLVLASLPSVLGTAANTAVLLVFMLIGVVLAALVTASGGNPSTKAHIASTVTWAICAILYTTGTILLEVIAQAYLVF